MTQATIGSPPGRRRLVGHALKMRKDGFAVMDAARGCGDIAVLWLGPKPAYIVSHPDLIRQLLTTEDRNLDKGPLYENLAQLIGVSIGTLIGSEHRKRRRIVTPAYLPNPAVMADVAYEVASSWHPGRGYDLAKEMRRFSFTVMARTLFADAIAADAEREFVDLLPVALAGIAKYLADPTGVLKRLPTRDNRRINDALDRLKAIVAGAVGRYRTGQGGADGAELAWASGRGAESAWASGRGILAALVEARDPDTGRPLTAAEIRNEAMVLMSAGSETVAGVLSYACEVMAYDAGTASRLRAEAADVLESLPIAPERIPDLAFTERVVTELLRLYPPGALMSRRAIVDIDLGGHRIRAGAPLFFCPYLLHRRPELYPEPLSFDPDRWLPERAQLVPRHAFMPFGAGAHVCLGEKIAWQESIIAVATIARLWRLRPAGGRRPRSVLSPTLNLDTVNVTVEGDSL